MNQDGKAGYLSAYLVLARGLASQGNQSILLKRWHATKNNLRREVTLLLSPKRLVKKISEKEEYHTKQGRNASLNTSPLLLTGTLQLDRW